jgi:hypothetical protein
MADEPSGFQGSDLSDWRMQPGRLTCEHVTDGMALASPQATSRMTGVRYCHGMLERIIMR